LATDQRFCLGTMSMVLVRGSCRRPAQWSIKRGYPMGKRVSKEIKAEILGKVKAGQRVVELATQYGISDKSIYGWLRQDTDEAVVSALEYNRLKRENEELKRLVGELTLNMHVQKKSK